MSTIDERVVSMKFDNAQFEQGAKQSIGTLDNLNKSLKLEGATKGLNDVANSASKLNLGSVGNAVQTVAGKFSALSTIAMGALAGIGFKAAMVGAQVAKSLTIDPIKQGLQEYETNLNSIQTILANTQVSGASLKDVNGALQELNIYSDKTIYNFSEMARNIGTFTAAGVGLKPATAAIKGIANLAALSGSNSQQASSAMYQLSQAIASGKVSLMDWNSVVNAGMGGTTFQRALAQTAVAMGDLPKSALKLDGAMKNVTINGKSFRDSISSENGGKSWLTSDVLTKTLSQFTGDLSAAQIKAMGFKDSQVAAIQQMAKTAMHAATEVKTFSGLMDTTKESIGSGWSQTFQIVFGDFEEAKKLWTGASNAIGNLVSKSASARNKMLQQWKDNGGRTALIDTVKNAFAALGAIIKPIHDAFRQIFPATSGKQLAEITKTIRDFVGHLKMGAETADKVKRTFAGVFAVFGIVWDVLKEVTKTFFSLFGVLSGGSGSFLEITARVGDFLVKVREAIHNGEGLHKFFDVLRTVVAAPIKGLQKLGDMLVRFMDGLHGFDFSSLDGIKKRFESFGSIGDIITKVMAKIKSALGLGGGGGGGGGGGKTFLDSFADHASSAINKIGDALAKGLKNIDYNKVLDGLNTGLFAALVAVLHGFVKGGLKFDLKAMLGFSDSTNGFLNSAKGALDGLKDTMKAYQSQLKAGALLKIAGAIALLAASVVALSLVDSAKLAAATTALGAMFGELVGAMYGFGKVVSDKDTKKLTVLAIALILFATAVDLLTVAVVKLSHLSWEDLAKGMLGLAGILGALIGTMKLMPDDKEMIKDAFGILILAASISVLVSSVKSLAGMSWEGLAKGLGGVALLLGSLLLFNKFNEANKGGLGSGAGLLMEAFGIAILAQAMKQLSGLSWEGIAKGLVALGGALQLMSWTLAAVPPTAPLGAAAVLIVAISLSQVATFLERMGKMSWGEIGKAMTSLFGALTLISAALYVIPPTAPLGAAAILIVAMSLSQVMDFLERAGQMDWGAIGKAMTVLGGTLLILAVGVSLMMGALPGAVAMVVVAAGLAALIPVLALLGLVPMGDLAASLGKLALTFAVIGISSLLLIPAVPILMGMGVAITLLGIGMLAAGAGMYLFSNALTSLSASGQAGAQALQNIVLTMIGLLPMVGVKLGEAVIMFAKVIATSGPAILNAITTVLMAIIGAINRVAPQIIALVVRLGIMMLNAARILIPKMVTTGMDIILALLRGVRDRIGQIVTVAVDIVTRFINGIGNNIGKITNAGADLIIKFVNSLAKTIETRSQEMGEAGGRLATAIIKGMAKGLTGGVGEIVSAAKGVAQSALNAAKNLLGIHSPSKEFEKIGNYVNDGFRKGLDGNKGQIDSAFNSLKGQLSSAMKDSAKDVDSLEKKLKKLTHARHEDHKAIKATTAAIAQAKKEHAAEAAAYAQVTRALSDEHTTLGRLATKQAQIAAKLKDANQKLVDAIKTRDDYNKQITDQYNNRPDIQENETLASYVADIRKQIADTQTFTTAIQKLRNLGLNDEMYKQLLEKGPAALPFITDVLASGKDGVDELNKLGKQLDDVAGNLGNVASKQLYQAGVNAAQGLVKGLQKQQAAIEAQMDKIAAAMIAAIKKALGIRSPSREFAKLGKFSIQGLVKGLWAASDGAHKATAQIGRDSLESLRKSLLGASDIWGEVDSQPTIRPVLDLSDVKKGFGAVDGWVSGHHRISVGAAYSTAKGISGQYEANRTAQNDSALASHSESVTFNQFNNSPKALSSADIYRQTKNQLSVAKGALTKPNA